MGLGVELMLVERGYRLLGRDGGGVVGVVLLEVGGKPRGFCWGLCHDYNGDGFIRGLSGVFVNWDFGHGEALIPVSRCFRAA